MDTLLRWVAAQVVGILLSAAVLYRDIAVPNGIRLFQTKTLTEFLMSYADKLAGLGITLCVFALNDLIFRATDPVRNLQCVGLGVRFPAFFLLYLLIVYVLVYGIALMTVPFALRNLFAAYPSFFYGFLILLAATLVLSLTYAVRLEIAAFRH